MFGASDNEQDRRRFLRRIGLVGLAQVAGFGVLGSRLYQLQVVDQRRYEQLAKANRTMRQVIAPLRGRIFDRNGQVVADTVESFQAILTPSLAGDLATALDRIHAVVPLSAEVRRQVRETVKGQSPNAPIVLLDELSWRDVAVLNFHALRLPGVHTQIAGRRRYRTGPEFGRIVGYLGRVERFALDDDPVLRLPSIKVGRLGVERGLEGRLRGRGGVIVREVDARRRIVRTLEQVDPERGEDVALTIDPETQKRLLSRLAGHRRAAGAVIDIATGDVVALGAHPSFDASRLSAPMSEADWRKVREAQGDPLIDRASQGQYPPGSTFKMITALAALEAGVINRLDHIHCPGYTVMGRRRFRCWNRGGHGPCNLHRAIKESCDVYFYEIARKTGIERIAEMARRFGLGLSYEAGIAPIKSGLIPDPEWKRGRYGKAWYGGETLLTGIGQGYVLSTPLQLAVMTARLASGREIFPTLVRPRGDGREKAAALKIDRGHLAAVQRAMGAVVNEGGGTGKEARLGDSRLRIYGKTGTSQVARISASVGRSRLPWRLRDHALFVGYVADRAPQYAVAAVVEHGGSGGKVAAPLVRDIIADTIAIDAASRPVFDVTAGQRLAGRRTGGRTR
jgi:penicillin-binding protein 2